MMTSKRLLAVAVSAALYAPLSVFATNGMNMEGYGPVATGMGGASMAYDNGTAGMANNVATLGMMAEGNQVDVAVGVLSPDIHSDLYGKDSGATSFLMPAMGWAQKSGQWAYGAGVVAQGGMGTEYDLMMLPGLKDRSEVGVGRFMVPLVYSVNDKLNIGASLDYVWASMDLQMTAPTPVIGQMVTGGTGVFAGPPPATWWGRFDFSDSSDYTGAAKGQGFAAKLGLTYKVAPSVTMGFNYQSETSLSDLETSDSAATVTFYDDTFATMMALPGKVTVKDFQWPQTFGLGMAWNASDTLMVAADIKQIQWSEVMKNFKMSFSSAAGTIDIAMPQNWDDQTVIELGAAYKFTPAFTGRAGVNIANNPVPDSTVNPLFPAIIETHYTLGAGYAINQAQDVNFSMTYAPEVSVNNPYWVNQAGSGKITHSQFNWQLMYSHRF